MRPSRRFFLSLHAVYIFVLLGVGSVAARAQAPASQPSQLPPAWDDAVRALAEKIALAAAPSHVIDLDVKNLSTLGSGEISTIHLALENQLKDRHFRFGAASSAEFHAEVTFSESAEGRIAVTKFRRDNVQQVIITSVPNGAASPNVKQRESLTLTSKLIRAQSERILDFALFDRSSNLESTLLIVEPERLAFYRSVDSDWELMKTTKIPHSKPVVRDMEAKVELDKNEILLSDAECSGYLTEPEVVHCSSTGAKHGWSSGIDDLPGHEGSESTSLSEKCDGGLILLASGNSDWTEPDSIQGYEYVQHGIPAVPAGNVISFEGPILSLHSNGESVVARAVVHNLRTGNYEAYLVTATCSH